MRGGFLLQRNGDALDASFEVVQQILPRMRHVATWVDGDRLYLAYSRIGDAPEHIVLSYADMQGPPADWKFSAPVTVLKPEEPWEGVAQPVKPSREGRGKGPLHELRNPALFPEGDTMYLFYSIAGERGLAIAETSLDAFRELAISGPPAPEGADDSLTTKPESAD
jgi:hypothetical protein